MSTVGGTSLPSVGNGDAAVSVLQQRLVQATRMAEVERRLAGGEFFVDRFTYYLANASNDSLDGNLNAVPTQNDTQGAAVGLLGLNAPNANNLLQNNGLPNAVNPSPLSALELDPVLKAAQLAMHDYINAAYPQAQHGLTASLLPPNFVGAASLNPDGLSQPEEIVSKVGPSLATTNNNVATEVAEPPNANGSIVATTFNTNGSIVATTSNTNGIIEALREAQNKIRLKESPNESPTPKPSIPPIPRGVQLKSQGKRIRESRPLPTNTVETASKAKRSRQILPTQKNKRQKTVLPKSNIQREGETREVRQDITTNQIDRDNSDQDLRLSYDNECQNSGHEEYQEKQRQEQAQPPDTTEREKESQDNECSLGRPVVPCPMDNVGTGFHSQDSRGNDMMMQILQKKNLKDADAARKVEIEYGESSGKIVVPGPMDYIMGGHGKTIMSGRNSGGYRLYRQVLEKLWPSYETASKMHRKDVVKSVLFELFARGVRFIKQDKNYEGYVEITEKEALDKIIVGFGGIKNKKGRKKQPVQHEEVNGCITTTQNVPLHRDQVTTSPCPIPCSDESQCSGHEEEEKKQRQEESKRNKHQEKLKKQRKEYHERKKEEKDEKKKRQEQQCDDFLEEEVVPGPLDIILGRGRHSKNSPGSIIFRQVLHHNQKEYDTIEPMHKGVYTRVILLLLKEKNVRFLKRVGDGKYKEIDEEAGSQKISHGFRNLRSTVPSSNLHRQAMRQKEKEQKYLSGLPDFPSNNVC